MMNKIDNLTFNNKWEFNEEGTILWYQSMIYDAEYQKDPNLFIQKCKDGWHGEKESDGEGRNSPAYNKWMKDVKNRDKVCQCCGSDNNLDIHHIRPYATHKKLRVDINNGIALCELHHSSMILGGFHQTYGTRNNTPEQLLEYIKTKRKELGITDTSFIKSPLLLEHIIREAELYEKYIKDLESNCGKEQESIQEVELFWNQIMMEHALFIRGLLDPTEFELINTADDFANEYGRLIMDAREMNERTICSVTNSIKEETIKYRDFKEAGAKGINECKIRSLIVPLLADHVLREANHYLRILDELE